MNKITKFIEEKEKEFLEVEITDLLVLIHGSEFEKPILAKLRELLTNRKQFLTQSLLEMAKIAREEEAYNFIIKLDSIVNAHLWGDYGLSTKEVYDGCSKFLEEMKKSMK